MRLPIYVRILIGVVLGTLTGIVLKERAGPFGDIGILIIQLLKALATPLILFAVIDAFLRTRISARKGGTLILLSLLNATVAIVIALTLANLTNRGREWSGQLTAMAQQADVSAPPTAAPPKKAEEAAPTLDPIKNLAADIPTSFLEPFEKNNIIAVVLLAVLMGAGLRTLKNRVQTGHPPALVPPELADPGPEGNVEEGVSLIGAKDETALLAAGLQTIETGVHALFRLFVQILEWIVQILPFAVFGVVAKVVGKTGAGVFHILGYFLVIVLLGLFIQAIVYYGLLLRFVGKMSPRRFYSGALDAIITALSSGSSLATLPVTLRCLKDRLQISDDSARLAACVGTNLNHDGIILYEAVAALFAAQAFGYTLSIGQQITVAVASVMAGIGIAGVPEAGLITLPLVLSATGLPPTLVATIIPLILPVDWIIGRGRATTNVLSDMTVATLLDRLYHRHSD